MEMSTGTAHHSPLVSENATQVSNQGHCGERRSAPDWSPRGAQVAARDAIAPRRRPTAPSRPRWPQMAGTPLRPTSISPTPATPVFHRQDRSATAGGASAP